MASQYEHANACYEMIKIYIERNNYDEAQKYVDIIKNCKLKHDYNTINDIDNVLTMEKVIRAYKINNGKEIDQNEIEKKIWNSIYNN